jgi:hypothetical protein
MDSQHSATQLNILNLPEDILREIFRCFEDKGRYRVSNKTLCIDYRIPYPFDEDLRKLKTVQAIRLVCRAFCWHVSPLLLPVLRVSISTKSLNRADQLTMKPPNCIRRAARPSVSLIPSKRDR